MFFSHQCLSPSLYIWYAWSFLKSILLFLKYCIYLFLERGEGREKEGERNINVWLPLMCPVLRTWPATQACALTGNRTGNPLVHRLALNPLSHTSQGCIVFFQVSHHPDGVGEEREESSSKTIALMVAGCSCCSLQ